MSDNLISEDNLPTNDLYLTESQSYNSGEKLSKKSEKLTIDTALDKYFYPLTSKIQKYFNTIDFSVERISKIISKQKLQKKHKLLKLFLKIILAFGLGYGIDLLLTQWLLNISVGFQLLAFIGITACSFGLLQIIHTSFRNIINNHKKKKLLEELKQFRDNSKQDIKLLSSIMKTVDALKKINDVTDENACIDAKTKIATLNQDICLLIKQVYSNNFPENLKTIIDKYTSNISACYKDISSIKDDFNILKVELKNLPFEKLNVTNLIAKNDASMIQSCYEELQKAIFTTIIPFAQVLNVKSDQLISKFEAEQDRQQKLAEKQKEIELKVEDDKYKEFFEQYGIEESLLK